MKVYYMSSYVATQFYKWPVLITLYRGPRQWRRLTRSMMTLITSTTKIAAPVEIPITVPLFEDNLYT
jgi:hypothetical protein